MTLTALLDLLLAFGATLRLIRLLTVDDLGRWMIRDPLYRRAPSKDGRPYDPQYEGATLRQKIVSGLDCPFCVGFWLGAVVLATLVLCGGPGHDSSSGIVIWRYVAGAFTLSYVSAHISARLDHGSDE